MGSQRYPPAAMLVPVALFLAALAVRAATAALFGDPAYPDSSYYVDVARQLAAGHGLQVDFIWGFVEVGGRLPDAGILPVPSNAHWMPLAAFIQVPFIWLLGPTAFASGLPFWLTAAAVAPVTWWIGRDAGIAPGPAAAAAALTILPGGVSPYLSQPDNFALFMLLGALSLWLCARGLRGDRRAFALGGLVVGLAFLSRNDGVLLGVPYAVAFAADLARRPRASRIGWPAAITCAALCAIVAGPWLARQLAVFGSISPSAANGCILFIRDYRQLYSADTECTLQAFLAQGAGPLAASRLGGLVSALGIFATMPLLIFLAPFTLIGAWQHRRDPSFLPWFVYAFALFVFSALLFAVHVPYGTFLHSAVALVPHAYLLAVLGVAAAVGAVARRRPTWQAPRATRVFTAMAVAVVMMGAVGGTLVTSRAWGAERDLRRQVSSALEGVPATDRLMSPDAGNYRYHAGLGGVVTPDDPLPVVEEALRRYEIRWLVLERDHITPSLAPLLAGRERPVWLSAPVLVVDGDTGRDDTETASLADAPLTMADLPRAALFAVCLDPSDSRCAG
jgi:4-amino-4-deoxy-L-arabinose transferase-like glycosyltransferase